MSRWRRAGKAIPPDATRVEEERRLQRLLKDLPPPEPPLGLKARVMAEIHAYEARPRGIRRLFQLLAPMRTAAVLTCGLAGWMFVTGVSFEFGEAELGSGPLAANLDRPTKPVVQRAPQARRSLGAGYAMPAGAFAAPAGLFRAQSRQPAPVLVGQPVMPPLDRRLDRQIDHLLHNPDDFFRRFAQIRERERYLERLASRSARRGDAADVGLRVRAIPHPMAPRVSERFLRASLVPAAHRR